MKKYTQGKRFDAVTVPAGTLLITRDGMLVEQWVYFSNINSVYSVHGVVGDRSDVYTWTSSGKYMYEEECSSDLFVAEEIKREFKEGAYYPAVEKDTGEMLILEYLKGDFYKGSVIYDESYFIIGEELEIEWPEVG